MRNDWKKKVFLGLTVSLLASCQQNEPEVPPTTILGSGIIFTFKEGLVRCAQYQEPVELESGSIPGEMTTDVKLRCFAAMPVVSRQSFLASSIVSAINVELVQEVSGFADDIEEFTWGPMHIQSGDQITIITDFVAAPNLISAIYTVPGALMSDGSANVTVSPEVLNQDGAMRTIRYDYAITVVDPSPSANPSPGP